MSRRNWPPVSVDFDPVPAESLCQVVTGEQGRGSCDRSCDCRHTNVVKIRGHRGARTADWNICVDAFTGTAVTYSPVLDEELGHELMTQVELGELL